MAELATIARPYAEALFQVVKSDASAALAWLDGLATVAADVGLQQFAHDPKSTDAQVLELFKQVAPANLPPVAINFLSTLIDNGRLGVLTEIAQHFHALVDAQSGVRKALVHSAFPIEGAALDDLAKVLEKRFGSKLHVQVALEPELIGGVRVVVGDEVLDTSVKARLEQMKVALTA
ncbi:MAG: F0F1 ATP synthase subunit delta [Burkholderiales bacterium]|jgi:F-type H+-transporting ATPase subunit delta|nr:F0F1 ATP synthase subunit delta [Burkholderiales bacterium]